MRILVLGGTGAMGAHLVEIAASRGMEVHVTSRTRDDSGNGVQYIRGNAQDDVFLRPILKQKWDAVVDFMVYRTPDFVGRLSALLAATTQYFFLSSARVYADSPRPITEDSPRLLDVSADKDYLATDEYALAKARQEDVLRGSGMRNWTIIRPYITYSRERLQLGVFEKEGWLYRALRGRSIVFSCDINQRKTTMTSGWDVAKAIVALIGNTGAMGEAFHITTSPAYAWSDILGIYLKVLEEWTGTTPRVILAEMPSFLKCHAGRYQVTYDRVFDRTFDNAKIARYTNLREFMDPKDGLRESLEAFLAKPVFKEIDWRGEAAKDRIGGESTPLQEIRRIKPKVRYALSRYLQL